ncbi:MAG: helix-turn-helix domain-containing protein [Treponema sp.]|nr:helix-turn-helix domain-containing protein [Treponema sp.]
MEAKEFWARVKTLLKEKGISQKQLSLDIGGSERSVEVWIAKDNVPDAFEAYKIAKILGVTVEYLVTGEYVVNDESARLMEEAQKMVLEAIEILQRPLPAHRRKELNLPSSSQQ